MTAHGLNLPITPHPSEGPDNDGFFEDLGNTTPYLKIAFEGFQGSGKTRTMVETAIGLHKRIGSKKPIVFISSEKAGKFLKPIFARAGIRVIQRETKSPADLREAMKRCRAGVTDILCIDSITHFWKSFVEAYKLKLRRDSLEMRDWGIVNPAWEKEIVEPFVDDPYHCLMTGRAGYEYDSEEREDNPKKRDIYKSGIKMKAGGELGYEPDILVLMSRQEDILGDEKSVYREATILKDRSSLIDGKTFRNPTYDNFAPAVEQLLADTMRSTTTPPQDSTILFKTEEDRRAWMRRRDAALETIEAELSIAWVGSTGGDKAMKLRALKEAFEETSWTKIQGMRPEILEAGLVTMRDFITTQKAIEAIDADLLTVWPGSSADARGARRAALQEFWKAESVGALDTKGYAILTDGAKAFRAKYMPETVAAPEGEKAGASTQTQPATDTAAAPADPARTDHTSPSAAAAPAERAAGAAFTLGDLKRQAKRARMSHTDLASRYAKESLDDFTAADIAAAMGMLEGMIDSQAAA